MLTELCQYLRNWFVRDILQGDFEVSGGVLSHGDGSPLPLVEGQYYRVIGSLFSDGVHQLGGEEAAMPDERFSGAVWSMAVPPSVVTLAAEIGDWVETYGEAVQSPFSSETITGVYSYTKAAGGTESGDGGAAGSGWQMAFRDRLTRWRKI